MMRYELNEPDVVTETIDAEAIVINLERGVYFSMRSTGLFVWTQLIANASVDEVGSELSTRFAVAGNGMKEECRTFADGLFAEGLLRLSNATRRNSEVAAGAIEITQYEPPVFEKYTDMEALLLLDPIHDTDETGWPNRP